MSGDPEVPARLLAALESALRDLSYSDVRLRDIAARASTTNPMIAYYFVDRDGMFIALVEQMLEVVISDLRTLGEILRVHSSGFVDSCPLWRSQP